MRKCRHEVDLSEIMDSLHSLHRKVDVIMTVQSDIDAATQTLNTLVTDVATNVSQLQVDVTAIQTALNNLPPSVDTSALDTAVANAATTAANLDAAVSNVTALAPPAA